jgi:hypothetical protein
MKSIDPRKALLLGVLIATLAGCAVRQEPWNNPSEGYNGGYGGSYPNLNGLESSHPDNIGYESSYPSNDVGYDRTYASAGSLEDSSS